MDKLDTQKRFLIATVLSLLVFIAYDYFYASKQRTAKLDQTKQETQAVQAQNAAPQITDEVTTVKNNAQNTTAPSTSTSQDETLVTVNSDNFIFQIDKLGRISQVTLQEVQYVEEDGSQIKLFGDENVKPLEMRYVDKTINDLAFKTPFTSQVSQVTMTNEPVTVHLTQQLGDVTVNKDITFFSDGHYKVDVALNKEEKFFITPGDKPVIAVDGFAVHGALMKTTDDIIEIIKSGDAKGDERFGNINIASAFSKYYATMFFDFQNPRSVSVVADRENPILFVSGDTKFSIEGYIGPKSYKQIHAIDPELTDAIEYGFFTFIAAPVFKVLQWIHNYVGNWGWSIVGLTILMRLILFPLTHKGMTSMQKLKELAPRIKQLQEKYKDDKQKLNAHMMDFYKKNKVNPMGGCFPLLLQIPVFFAVYRVLINAPELKGSEWILWINDLSAMDPYFILPILMGASMWFQQKISPNNFTDPMQKKIFEYLPVIFTFFFITFPAGLVLYWLVNNLASIAQQWFINKQFEAKAQRLKDAKS